MENLEKFEQLLQQRSYEDLTAEERKWVNTMVSSPSEYESLRELHLQIKKDAEATRGMAPGKSVLANIKATRKAAQSVQTTHWLTAPMPAYATALLLILVGVLSWYGGSQAHSPMPIATQIQRIDTVFIASKPDTIVRERVIYLKAKSITTSVQPQNVLPTAPSTKGVNMKENEELDRLLVTGSD